MRTTLSLDRDVSALIERLRKARGASLKSIVNEALRLGLQRLTEKRRPRKPYCLKPVDLGRCRIGSLDSVSDALALAEGESFR